MNRPESFLSNYDEVEHRHRFSAWAASRAASVKGCRFKVDLGKRIIEKSGLKKLGASHEYLPVKEDFDENHRDWREAVIQEAKDEGLPFTHGIAAKLINIYLKSIYLCGSYLKDERVKAIHPPIDRLLLDALYQNSDGKRKARWREFRKIGWSKLDGQEYQMVIDLIKEVVPEEEGLWKIEAYWRGFQ